MAFIAHFVSLPLFNYFGNTKSINNTTDSGYMGASLCMILSSWGSAWGTWRAGLGVCHMGIDHPAGIIKNIVPIVMAGVLGIYGLIVSVIITQAVVPPADSGNTYSSYNGYTHVSVLCVLCLRWLVEKELRCLNYCWI